MRRRLAVEEPRGLALEPIRAAPAGALEHRPRARAEGAVVQEGERGVERRVARELALSVGGRHGAQGTIETKEASTSMNPNKALWEKGDFTRIAASMRESGEALVAAARRSRRA